MVYRYTSIGMNLGKTEGKISYLHDSCAIKLNMTLGPNAVIYDGKLPLGAVCPWCGKELIRLEESL